MANKLTLNLTILIFFTIIVLIIPQPVNAESIYNWTNTVGSTSVDHGYDIKVDNDGNVYTGGYFNGTVDFDPSAGTDNHISNGGSDIYVTKVDSDGNYLWTNTVGGTTEDVVSAIAIDSNGDVIVVGTFTGTVDFDPSAGTDSLVSSGGNDIFITKYNSNGSYAWTNKIGSTSSDHAYGVVIGNNDFIYVTGDYTGTVDFDPSVCAQTCTQNRTSDSSTQDIYIAAYDNSGAFSWVYTAGGTGGDSGNNIDIDSNGNIVAVGRFRNTVDFDPGAGTDNKTSSGGMDIFTSKLTSAGGYLWTNAIGGTSTDVGLTVQASSDDSVYISGYVFSTMDFDPGAGTDNYSNIGSHDTFVSKYNNDGSYAWTNKIAGTGSDIGYEIVTSPDGRIYLGGFFNGTVDFDPTAGTDNRVSNGGGDIFILRYESDGSYAWTETMGGANNDAVRGIDFRVYRIYISGFFESPSVDFDFTTGTDTHSNNGSRDMFTSKFAETVRIVETSGNFILRDISTQSDVSEFGSDFIGSNRVIRVSTTGNTPIAEIGTNLLEDRDWDAASISGDSDIVLGKSYMDNLTSAEGTNSQFTLYIPRLSGTNGVRICPGATSLVDVTDGCAGEYLLSQFDNSVSIVTINNQEYYRVTGLSGTGGEGESGVPSELPMRIVLRDSELSGQTTDTEVWFNTAVDVLANTIIYFSYDSNHTGGNAITTSDITATCDADGFDPLTGTGMTNVTVTDSQNGYLELNTNADSCSNWVVVDINGDGGNQLTNPVNPGNYSWSISYDVGGDGTIDIDGATLAYVADENDITITANVPPVLDMELYESNVDTLLNGTGANTCELGVLSINTISTCTYDIGTGTNNSSGVSVYIQSDGELRDGSGNSIDACSGTNCDSLGGAGVSTGEEEYGIYISELGNSEYTAGGSFGSAHQGVPTVETLFASSSTTGSGTTTGSIAQRLEVTHAASISTATTQGGYSHIITYTAFTN